MLDARMPRLTEDGCSFGRARPRFVSGYVFRTYARDSYQGMPSGMPFGAQQPSAALAAGDRQTTAQRLKPLSLRIG